MNTVFQGSVMASILMSLDDDTPEPTGDTIEAQEARVNLVLKPVVALTAQEHRVNIILQPI